MKITVKNNTQNCFEPFTAEFEDVPLLSFSFNYGHAYMDGLDIGTLISYSENKNNAIHGLSIALNGIIQKLEFIKGQIDSNKIEIEEQEC